MPRFETRRRVPYSARQMYDLVADVERYPQFLPLCEALRVRSRETKDSLDVLVADMEVGYGAIRERFTSRVALEPEHLRIVVNYLDGPFRRLENRWTFVDVAGGSDVVFFIDYEFKSMVLQLLMGGLFDKAFRKFSEAFENRARKIYGPANVA